ncbi:hypothetical protein [Streptomyces kanasensis]|uniref:hypothetical protein n=1 Tax=Streptomyces kanasensis TaxID=936756 RepID=UPI0037F7FA13
MNKLHRLLLTAAAAAAVLGAALPASAAPTAAIGVPLKEAVAALPVATEHREGYNRVREFGGWVDADKDGCNTRAEVLLEEAVTEPEPGGAPSPAAAGTPTMTTPTRSCRTT